MKTFNYTDSWGSGVLYIGMQVIISDLSFKLFFASQSIDYRCVVGLSVCLLVSLSSNINLVSVTFDLYKVHCSYLVMPFSSWPCPFRWRHCWPPCDPSGVTCCWVCNAHPGWSLFGNELLWACLCYKINIMSHEWFYPLLQLLVSANRKVDENLSLHQIYIFWWGGGRGIVLWNLTSVTVS